MHDHHNSPICPAVLNGYKYGWFSIRCFYIFNLSSDGGSILWKSSRDMSTLTAAALEMQKQFINTCSQIRLMVARFWPREIEPISGLNH